MVCTLYMKTLSDSGSQSTAVTKKNSAFLFDTVRQSAPYDLLKKALAGTQPGKTGAYTPVNISGMQGSLSSIIAAAHFTDHPLSLMVLCGQNSFERYENDFATLLPKETLCNTSDELSLSIGALLTKKKSVILSFFDDLQVILCQPAEAEKRIFHLKTELDAGYEQLKRFLAANNVDNFSAPAVALKCQ